MPEYSISRIESVRKVKRIEKRLTARQAVSQEPDSRNSENLICAKLDRAIYCCISEGCKEFFYLPKSLSQHMKLVHKKNTNVLWECNYENCEITFGKVADMKQHVQKSHFMRIEPVPLIRSEDMPETVSSIKTQVLRNGQARYSCTQYPYCEGVYKQADGWGTHMKNVHNIEVRIVWKCGKKNCGFYTLEKRDFLLHNRLECNGLPLETAEKVRLEDLQYCVCFRRFRN